MPNQFVIDIPDGYEIADLKFQLKPCKQVKIPVVVKPRTRTCDICTTPCNADICSTCYMDYAGLSR